MLASPELVGLGLEMIVDPEGSGSSGWEPPGTCAKTGSAKMTAEAARIVATRDARREKIREQPLDESDVVFIFLHTFKAVSAPQQAAEHLRTSAGAVRGREKRPLNLSGVP